MTTATKTENKKNVEKATVEVSSERKRASNANAVSVTYDIFTTGSRTDWATDFVKSIAPGTFKAIPIHGSLGNQRQCVNTAAKKLSLPIVVKVVGGVAYAACLKAEAVKVEEKVNE